MNDLLKLFLVPLSWLAAFSAIYGLHGLGCASGWELPLLRGVLIAAWILGGALLLGLAVGLGPQQPFLRRLHLLVSGAAILGFIGSLFPLFVISPCGV